MSGPEQAVPPEQETTVEVIRSALINPRIEWGTVMFDGVMLPHLTVQHPVHGPITCLIPREVGLQVSRGLLEVCSQHRGRQ